MEKNINVFEELVKVNVDKNIEVKDTGKTKLKYLSWTFAVSEITKRYPDWTYEIVKFGEAQLPYTYDPLTGFLVYTRVTIEGQTKEMWLPVMDGNNRAMKSEPYTFETKYGPKTVEGATMFDINKTIMRCLVKNLAMFGLGLYIYSGEDLPESVEDENISSDTPAKKSVSKKTKESFEDSFDEDTPF